MHALFPGTMTGLLADGHTSPYRTTTLHMCVSAQTAMRLSVLMDITQ